MAKKKITFEKVAYASVVVVVLGMVAWSLVSLAQRLFG